MDDELQLDFIWKQRVLEDTYLYTSFDCLPPREILIPASFADEFEKQHGREITFIEMPTETKPYEIIGDK
jgi:hypothetical protein